MRGYARSLLLFTLLLPIWLRDCSEINCTSGLRQNPGVERWKVTPYYNMSSLSIVQPRELSRSPDVQFIPEQSLNSDAPSDFRVELSADRPQLSLGEDVVLHIRLEYPPGYHVDKDKLIDQLLWTANPTTPQFMIRQQPLSKDQKSIDVILEPLQEGICWLSLQKVSFEKVGAPSVSQLSPVLQLEVLPAPPQKAYELADLHPLQPALPLGLSADNRYLLMEDPHQLSREATRNQSLIRQHSFFWTEIFEFLLLLLMLGGATAWWQHHRKKQHAKMMENAAYLHAQKGLTTLKERQLAENSRFQDYFIDLKEIALTFLAQKHQIHWQSLTSDEIEKIMSTNVKEILFRNKLIDFLRLSDRVEFAGYKPSLNECSQAHTTIQSLITRHSSHILSE